MVSTGPAHGLLSINTVTGTGADLLRVAGRSVERVPDSPTSAGRSVERGPDSPTSPALDRACRAAESSARPPDISQEELDQECPEEADQPEGVVPDDHEVVAPLEELAGSAPRES